MILMGSGAETARADRRGSMQAAGEKVGVLQVRLYRPFSAAHFLAALPETVRRDRRARADQGTGRAGEPLYLDIVTTLAEAVAPRRAQRHAARDRRPLRFVFEGIHPGDGQSGVRRAASARAEERLHRRHRRRRLPHQPRRSTRAFSIEAETSYARVFYGLGADGTVGANKNSVKIIAEDARHVCAGLFRLRFAQIRRANDFASAVRPEPIQAPYLIDSAEFVACHQFGLLERQRRAATRGTGRHLSFEQRRIGPDEVWDRLPRSVQQQIIDKKLRLFVIDASKVARDVGLGTRINTVLQTCFFAISGVLPRDEGDPPHQGGRSEKTYGDKGQTVVRKNFAAVDATLARLIEVPIPATATSSTFERCRRSCRPTRRSSSATVTAMMMAGRGDEIPVSANSGRRHLSVGHRRIRKAQHFGQRAGLGAGPVRPMRPMQLRLPAQRHPGEVLPRGYAGGAPAASNRRRSMRADIRKPALRCSSMSRTAPAAAFASKSARQISPREPDARRSIWRTRRRCSMPSARISPSSRRLPVNDRARVDFANVRGVQFLEPLFEFSGACAGCGETPYLKLLIATVRRSRCKSPTRPAARRSTAATCR